MAQYLIWHPRRPNGGLSISPPLLLSVQSLYEETVGEAAWVALSILAGA